MRREPAYLRDALRALDELQDFTARTTQQQFLSNPLEQSYVFYRLVIFGEAMSRLAGAFQTKYPDLPWSAIISLRNRLVHAYFDLELPLVWRIATTHVDQIVERLRHILKTEFPEDLDGES